MIGEDTFRQCLEACIALEDLLDLAWQSVQTFDDLSSAWGKRNPVFGQLKSYHEESNVLRSVGLERGISGNFF